MHRSPPSCGVWDAACGACGAEYLAHFMPLTCLFFIGLFLGDFGLCCTPQFISYIIIRFIKRFGLFLEDEEQKSL